MKTPSEPLASLIESAAERLTDFVSIWSKVKEVGVSEGFTEQELQDLVRIKVRARLESIGVEKPKIKNTIYYMFNQDKHAEKNAKAYEKRKSLINQTNDHNNVIEQSSSGNGASFDDLVSENNSLTQQLAQAKKDLQSASFEGTSTKDFLIVKRDQQSNNYLARVKAVEAASVMKSLIEADEYINVGWELA